MREQVRRLEKLATELLDLSRLDAGHIDLDREAVALDDVARTAADEFAAVALQRGHELEVAAAPERVLAIADEQRLLQIARILVENAIVHTPEGTHVRIAVTEERGSARLAVSDDGPGIAEGEAANIFERFYRLDTAQASGSGLGLAIARELARLMGGSLELERTNGRTSFAITLPAAAASESGARAAPAAVR